ncbi:hypothetical protein SAMN04488040_3246 [Sulfitobacter marinus]|uniref:Uncharacterized protein n=1 Tax=Sulfitobacter marinus TaxID=394264 RepID=A0A1I6VDE7_9RHOB|nr:hypothetical protein [Sulfitobacter marinus]SFT11640.1 hypothetical protein SAMN04488040_3246 [Sulfitobacter marinus]
MTPNTPQILRLLSFTFHRGFFVLFFVSLSLFGVVYFEPKIIHSGFVEQLTVGGGILEDADKNRDIRFLWWMLSWQMASLIVIAALLRQSYGIWRGVFFSLLAVAGLLTVAQLVSLDSASFQTQILFGSLLASGGIAFTSDRENWSQLYGIGFLVAVSASVVAQEMAELSAVGVIAVALPATIFLMHVSGPDALRWAGSISALIMAGVSAASAPIRWVGLEGAHLSILDGLHALLAIVLIIEAVWVFRARREGGSFTGVLPRISTALAIVVLTGPAMIHPVIPLDDYHFGEKLLAAQAFYSGAGWFTEFFSPHGLSNATGGFAAWLLGDPTASGILVGERILLLYAWGTLVVLLLCRLGPLPALLFALVIPEIPHVIYLTLNLVLGLAIVSLRRPSVAGAGGVAVAVFGALFNGGLGAAAAIVIALSGVILHGRRGRWDFIAFCAGSIASGVVILVLFHEQLLGYLAFLTVSSAANLTIYGNGSFSVIEHHFDNFLYVFAPVLTLAVAAIVGSKQWRDSEALPFWLKSLLVIVPTTALAIIMNPYATGRLDFGDRGMITTVALMVFATVWLSSFFKRRNPPLVASLLSVLLIGIMANQRTSFERLSLPPVHLELRGEIAEDMPTLGWGAAHGAHLAMLRDVNGVVNAVLEPGETFLNLTNRNAFYFYFDRANPVPIASTYNAAPGDFQRQFTEASELSLPALAILAVNNIEHDGISLPLRSHHIFEFVETHYVPFVVNGNVYGIRTDLTERLTGQGNREAPVLGDAQTFRTGSYTDANWHNGVAVGENAAVWSFAVQPSMTGLLEAGDRLAFSDGVNREVTRVEGASIRVAPPLPAHFTDDPTPPIFTVQNRTFPAELIWANVLHQQYLWRIPSSWGRSVLNLSDQIGGLQQLTDPAFYGTVAEPGTTDVFRVTNSDPMWIYAPPEPLIPSEGSDILSLDAECVGSDVHPIVSVYWRSPDTPFSERNMVNFEASNRKNLVPLDTTLRWRSLPAIAEIRIDIANPSACALVSLGNVAMLERL